MNIRLNNCESTCMSAQTKAVQAMLQILSRRDYHHLSVAIQQQQLEYVMRQSITLTPVNPPNQVPHVDKKLTGRICKSRNGRL